MTGKNNAMMRNEYIVTWKVYKSWLWENKMKPPRLVFTIIWGLFGLAMTALFVLSLSPLYLLMLIFCIYRLFFRDTLVAMRQYGIMAKTYGQKDWLRTIVFDREQITLQEGQVSVNYAYADISEVREQENKVWLIFRNKAVIRMYKDCFVDSDWEACRDLIEEKRSA